MAIRRRKLDDRGVESHAFAGEEARDVGEKDRHEVSPAFGDRFAETGAGEERDRPEATGLLGRREGERALEMDVPEFHPLEIGPSGESVEQRRRRGRRSVDEHVHPAENARDDCVCRLGTGLPGLHGEPPLAIALPHPDGSHHEPLAARSSKNVL